MSAITAIYYRDGEPVDRTAMERMTEALAHRGSDGFGTWNDGPVGLGNRLSWTTPESLGEILPLMDPSGDLHITADARIDNRDELLDGLRIERGSAKKVADSQLILASYEKWGESCVERLLGDFAFAIWDRRRKVVFCARDAIGVRPLYYYLSDRTFVLASEIKALFCNKDVPSELNERRVADHVLGIFQDKVSTFYRNIFRLAPAHTMTVGTAAESVQRYWSLDPVRELRLRSDGEYSEAFRDIFSTSVGYRMRSAFPVGSTLSGGLDSSSIACTARNLLKAGGGDRLHTYSAIFPGLPESDLHKIDERRYVDAVLALGDFEPHFIRADKLNPIADLEKVLWHQDEPFLAPNMYMHLALYEAARTDGVRVFLDGLDGDTTVCHGLTYLSELARKGKFGTLISEASKLSRNSPNPHFTLGRIAWQFGIRELVPERVENLMRRLLGRQQAANNPGDRVMNVAFAKRMKQAESNVLVKQSKRRRWQTTRESHFESLDSALIPYTLELADRASAAFGIDARYPFFDRRLIEFCLALPPDQKLNQGWTRIVMRRAMTGIIPVDVQWRIGKANLSPNFKRRLLDYGRPIIEEIMENGADRFQSYVDVPALGATYQRYASNPMGGGEDAMTLYGAVMLGSWLGKSQVVSKRDRSPKAALNGHSGSSSQDGLMTKAQATN